MKKIFIPLLFTLIFILIFPYANACFVSSDIEIKFDDSIPPVPLGEKVATEVNITFSWGFGAFLPLPLTIYLEVESPSWAIVTLSKDSVQLNPMGLFGGEESKNVELKILAREETEAFIEYPLTIRAYTDGNFLINGAENEKSTYIMQDFYDRGIEVEFPSSISLIKGESRTVYLNITNNCNAPLTIEIEKENVSGFSFIYDETVNVPSHSTKSFRVTITAEEISRTYGWLNVTYYSPEKGERRYVEVPVYLISASEGVGGGSAISIAIIIIIIAIIIYAVWKKR